MFRTAKEIKAELNEGSARIDSILAVAAEEKRDPTKEEFVEIHAFHGEGEATGQYGILETQLATATKIEARTKTILATKVEDHGGFDPENLSDASPSFKIPATAKRHGALKAFTDPNEAYASGQFLMATMLGIESSQEWCKNHGIMGAMGTSDNTKGGFLVPEGFEAAIIRLVEEHGVLQQYARKMPMISDTHNVPRRESGLTIYYPGEGVAITASDAKLGNVKLTAIKRATLTAISTELEEDSAVAIADFMASEIGTAFALKQDQDGFLGTGTSTYGGVVGLGSALAAGSTVDAASGNISFATLDLLEFETCIADLPVYADNDQTAWYIHKTGYAKSMLRLLNAGGGNSNVTLAEGVRSRPMFLGYPVNFTQAMPSADAVSTYQCYLGDLSQAITLGTRRGLTIKSDASVYFASDQLAVSATERLAINVHERGDGSTAGAVIGLKTAAS